MQWQCYWSTYINFKDDNSEEQYSLGYKNYSFLKPRKKKIKILVVVIYDVKNYE